jgi:hypothetical protein
MQKTHRVIYEITFLCWAGEHVTFTLDRWGNAVPPTDGDTSDGLPHPPKQRTADLRAGDFVWLRGAWCRIRGIVCGRDDWLTEEEAAIFGGDEGFVYRPRKPS